MPLAGLPLVRIDPSSFPSLSRLRPKHKGTKMLISVLLSSPSQAPREIDVAPPTFSRREFRGTKRSRVIFYLALTPK